ncbi:META domain-containing protein [Hydrogenimonas sp. SS33]|uniref:META domain-containing protein n=1 Tax=Hydrogenimonas leucolamina TaxID=2954236 RepID=UPI00336BD6C2
MAKRFAWLLSLLLLWQGCAVVNENGHAADGACEAKLYGRTWRLLTIDNEEVGLKFPATLTIARDGKMGGFDGCNRYFGKAEVTPTDITFGPVGSTRKYCMGRPGEVEKAMLGMFRGTKWWHFDPRNRLVIFDDEHRLIFAEER